MSYRAKLEGFFNHHWYSAKPGTSYYFAQAVLLPLTFIFALLSGIKRKLYQLGLLKSYKLAVPVIVVGNINVGGTGKTPLVIWLTKQLELAGYKPGIISRGFGGSQQGEVFNISKPQAFGDEPLLIARHSQCPVFVGKNRVVAGQALLKMYPQCNIIISDDGLQHMQLKRDVEVAVVDSQRLFGNSHLLPAGPLRESLKRLSLVDAIVLNGDSPQSLNELHNAFVMNLQAQYLVNLHNNQVVMTVAELSRKAEMNQLAISAVAGIGNPQRFFKQLTAMGLQFKSQAFPDHHQFVSADFNCNSASLADDIIVMTEKDAVKCQHFANSRMWYLPISAELPKSTEFITKILTKLNTRIV
ncbi:MAG: tetraacyldisaccharide 4'-kinase [Methylophilaceae bacterium]|nr:tetraacyldisaccharide 4'-kinase [Methylophilaceae bacterium]